MKRPIIYILFISLVFTCTPIDQAVENQVPGSFSSMQQMTHSRAYPNDDIPADGFYKGYLQHLRMKNTQVASRTFENEWESIGPFNISGRVLSVGINPQADSTIYACLLYTSPSPRDATLSRMPSSA